LGRIVASAPAIVLQGMVWVHIEFVVPFSGSTYAVSASVPQVPSGRQAFDAHSLCCVQPRHALVSQTGLVASQSIEATHSTHAPDVVSHTAVPD
jgi:hypothetical protein